MIRKTRRWDSLCEDDPAAGLLNLFDVWIAFSVALLLALVGYLNKAQVPNGATKDDGATPSVLEALQKSQKIPHFRPTESPLTGQGVRLGVAYQLQNGEVVYVPESAHN
jgi:hypothetical protein